MIDLLAGLIFPRIEFSAVGLNFLNIFSVIKKIVIVHFHDFKRNFKACELSILCSIFSVIYEKFRSIIVK